MTKKDYWLIVNSVCDTFDELPNIDKNQYDGKYVLNYFLEKLATRLKIDNRHFDKDKFMSAINEGVKKYDRQH